MHWECNRFDLSIKNPLLHFKNALIDIQSCACNRNDRAGFMVKSRPEVAMPPTNRCSDHVLVNDWHVVADNSMLPANARFSTRLLGIDLAIGCNGAAGPQIVRTDTGASIDCTERYGFIWACIGEPERDIVDIPEASEADRYLVSGGSIAVKVSGLRAVENFLDMGHFPFIHTGWLGEEPHT